ncbi:Endonuclease/Exonuclease/phosphatase family protein [Stieleria maiorica]|uniref:Endonuclease/Exonuclease/phosphatase family protein n=1 Tax=Stieleria maiorica TaxID=2795974 RepID=A0A5B9MR82_9BACT|nr:endonuclease/exonuclease/phosphatase family protein [Stieleria maiorica]QEG02286.1 Endonuclease/Exonuclease/phosphatase family protein [Stieleria maiorica]
MFRIRLLLIAVCAVGLVATDATAADPVRLRVLSYNIHHGEGVDGKLDVERIARVISSVNPDIVALQEVDQNVSRSGSVDQPRELARLTKMDVVFGANIDLQGGHYGNAVLSRFPILRHQNRLLPNIDDGEQRGVIEAEIQVPSATTPIVVWATHFDHRRDDRERFASAAAIEQWIADRGKTSDEQPMLLMGDLNDVAGSRTLTRLETHWTRVNDVALPTIPVANPTRQIDFILYRPQSRWQVIETRVLDESVASDHRALLSVVELSAETDR